jgi:hypothetical protein
MYGGLMPDGNARMQDNPSLGYTNLLVMPPTVLITFEAIWNHGDGSAFMPLVGVLAS